MKRAWKALRRGELGSENFDAIKGILQNSLVYFFFITAFLMAVASKLAFRKAKYNTFELYVAYLLLNGHLTVLSIVLLAVGQYNNLYCQIGLLTLSVIYPAIVIARIYLPHRPLAYVKSFAAAILGFFFRQYHVWFCWWLYGGLFRVVTPYGFQYEFVVLDLNGLFLELIQDYWREKHDN